MVFIHCCIALWDHNMLKRCQAAWKCYYLTVWTRHTLKTQTSPRDRVVIRFVRRKRGRRQVDRSFIRSLSYSDLRFNARDQQLHTFHTDWRSDTSRYWKQKKEVRKTFSPPDKCGGVLRLKELSDAVSIGRWGIIVRREEWGILSTFRMEVETKDESWGHCSFCFLIQLQKRVTI